MTHPLRSVAPLPDDGLDGRRWLFGEIAAHDPVRAGKLEAVIAPSSLQARILKALQRAITCGDLRVGREHKSDKDTDCRIALQFPVGTDLFDAFFNGRTGYRAYFRHTPECGLAFNELLVEAIRAQLAADLADTTHGHDVRWDRDTNGWQVPCPAACIPKSFVIRSLVPSLSKLWYCGERIEADGTMAGMTLGVGGPMLQVEAAGWTALYPDEDQAWLDLKGAFLCANGPYQPKCPLRRAVTLIKDGTA